MATIVIKLENSQDMDKLIEVLNEAEENGELDFPFGVETDPTPLRKVR
jgi:hypothetical protein